MSVGLVWFRRDLRIADNPALSAAASECDAVLGVYVDEPPPGDGHAVGAASRVWLHHSLAALAESLADIGGRLVVARGEPVALLGSLAGRVGAGRLYWNRRHDPDSVATDKGAKAALARLSPRTFNGALVFEPWEVLERDGTPYRVYTPYRRAVAARVAELGGEALETSLPAAPAKLAAPRADAGSDWSDDVGSLGLLPREPWHDGMIARWRVGETAARERLDTFLHGDGRAATLATAVGAPPPVPVTAYGEARDLPGIDGTSGLSPHLHHGEISPRRILAEVLRGRPLTALGAGEETFVEELVWREFAAMLLYHFPAMGSAPLDRRFERFPWNDEAGDPATVAALDAWRRGRTGVPIVDAGMRQLHATGWMHNRVRMIAASFLVKNLLVRWQAGEAWFRDCLVDADLASNAAGWQWVAGSGADAAPFYRVFNPVLQGRKFDADGAYVRRWVPELGGVELRALHAPWELARPPADYPAPIVDLGASRQRALDALAVMKGAAAVPAPE